MAQDPLEQELVKREMGQTQQNADPVIQRALSMVGQNLSPVRAIGFDEVQKLYDGAGRPMGTRASILKDNLAGFRLPNDPNIYVNTNSREYRNASDKNNNGAALILAGILAHEHTHGTEPSESVASRIEADLLRDKLIKAKLLPEQRNAVKARLQTAESWTRDPLVVANK